MDIVSGYIALKDNLANPIQRFTQADIDNALIVFVHKGIYNHYINFLYAF